ncbi:transposase [Streptomyces sp. ISL-36]|nr:transposase [Streptomyces sp. ISL-36]
MTSWASCSRTDFAIDWESRQVTCSNGATSSRWAEDRSQEGTAVVRARFPPAACRPCKTREQCTRSNGLAKARLQHQLTATAVNVRRLNAWWTETPRARTRTSRLAAFRVDEGGQPEYAGNRQ